jgi:hypothetical protein
MSKNKEPIRISTNELYILGDLRTISYIKKDGKYIFTIEFDSILKSTMTDEDNDEFNVFDVLKPGEKLNKEKKSSKFISLESWKNKHK